MGKKAFLLLIAISNYCLLASDTPIIVSAEKFSRAYERSSSTITKLGAEEITKSGANNVADLLKQQAGVTLLTSGSFGKASSLFLRGTSNRHTLIIIDGMRVTDLTAIGGGSRLEFLSTQNIESIEILKGSQGVLYGGEAIGGVIKITTKDSGSDATFRASAGSFGQFSLTGRSSLSRSSSSSSSSMGELQFSHNRADGISSYNDQKTTNAEADGFETTSVRYKNNFVLKNHEFNLNAFFQDSYSQFDSSNQDVLGNETNYQTYGVSGLWSIFKGKALSPKLSAEYRVIKTDSTVVSGSSSTLYLYDGSSLRSELSLPWIMKDDLEVLSGLSWEREMASALDTDFSDTKVRDRYSVYSQVRKDWSTFFTEFGARYETIESVDEKGLYRFALGINLGDWTVKAHQATGFKAPSLYQNFSAFGNRDLSVEKSISRELGLLYLNTKLPLKFELSLFSINYSNFVDFDNSSNRYENFGAQDNYGIESSLAFTIEKVRFLLEANLLRALEPTTGAYALRRPRQRHSLAIERPISSEWSGRLAGVYVGERMERNQVRMPSYLTIDLHLAYNVKEESVAVDFKNILDREYEEIRNFGTPGQNIAVSWERKF